MDMDFDDLRANLRSVLDRLELVPRGLELDRGSFDFRKLAFETTALLAVVTEAVLELVEHIDDESR